MSRSCFFCCAVLAPHPPTSLVVSLFSVQWRLLQPFFVQLHQRSIIVLALPRGQFLCAWCVSLLPGVPAWHVPVILHRGVCCMPRGFGDAQTRCYVCSRVCALQPPHDRVWPLRPWHIRCRPLVVPGMPRWDLVLCCLRSKRVHVRAACGEPLWRGLLRHPRRDVPERLSALPCWDVQHDADERVHALPCRPVGQHCGLQQLLRLWCRLVELSPRRNVMQRVPCRHGINCPGRKL